jgi:hypothetical protein
MQRSMKKGLRRLIRFRRTLPVLAAGVVSGSVLSFSLSLPSSSLLPAESYNNLGVPSDGRGQCAGRLSGFSYAPFRALLLLPVVSG